MHLHVDNQQGRSAIKENSQEDHSPTISYPSKNFKVKEEDEDLVCYLLMTLQDNSHLSHQPS